MSALAARPAEVAHADAVVRYLGVVRCLSPAMERRPSRSAVGMRQRRRPRASGSALPAQRHSFESSFRPYRSSVIVKIVRSGISPQDCVAARSAQACHSSTYCPRIDLRDDATAEWAMCGGLGGRLDAILGGSRWRGYRRSPSPAPDSQARSASLISVTATSRNTICGSLQVDRPEGTAHRK